MEETAVYVSYGIFFRAFHINCCSDNGFAVGVHHRSCELMVLGIER